MPDTGSGGRFLFCRIGSSVGAIPLEYVRETLRPLPIEPLAGMLPFLLGLAIIRGSPTPVIDSGRLLGSTAVSPTRFVSIRLGERTVALAVDAVLDVHALPAGVLAQVPPLLRGSGADCVSAIGALDAELLLVLEGSRLIPESLCAAIATAGATD